jgi:signal peptidase I
MTDSGLEGETAGAAGDKKPHKKKKANAWVENIESLTVAVVLALILRTFVVEAFVIPTGSMASSLYGDHLNVTCPNCGYRYAAGYYAKAAPLADRVRCPNCGSRGQEIASSVSGGDRILVNKVIYRFDPPHRWDPFVFINPMVSASDTPPYKTTYIKRLVGMPGEKFEIVRGDIVANGQIQRKPEDAQSTLWMPVYTIGCPWKEGTPWKMAGSGWRLEGKRLAADCFNSSGTAAWAEYAGGRTDGSGIIRDNCSYDQEGTSGRRSGFNVVTDVKVSFDVKVEKAGTLVLSLPCDEHDDRAEIDFSTGVAWLSRDEKALKSPVRLSDVGLGDIGSAGSHRIAFYRVDYLLALVIDGKKVVECDFWSAEEYGRLQDELARTGRIAGHDRSGVRLGAAGTKLELTNLRIDRDVYYTDAHQDEGGPHYMGPWDIPKDSYFAMGDNSPDSLDSRYWGVVPGDHLIGKALLIWYEPMRVRLIH